MSVVTICTFYKFVDLSDCERLAGEIQALCFEEALKGTVLLAPEGINGTVAGSNEGIERLVAWLKADFRLVDLRLQVSTTAAAPFYRLKVKVKPEIVSLRQADIDPTREVGRYVHPHDWNDLLADPEIVLIDTRNEYEVRVGSFTGAINPQTASFTDFPRFVAAELDPQHHQKVAMYCTGGIRCEKASALLLNMGFEEVYHLEGGILNYMAEIPPEESLWQGECFVFDNRVAVDHQLKPGSYTLCFNCREPLSAADCAHPAFEEGVSCLYCFDRLTPERRAQLEERQRQVLLARQRGEAHIGRQMEETDRSYT